MHTGDGAYLEGDHKITRLQAKANRHDRICFDIYRRAGFTNSAWAGRERLRNMLWKQLREGVWELVNYFDDRVPVFEKLVPWLRYERTEFCSLISTEWVGIAIILMILQKVFQRYRRLLDGSQPEAIAMNIVCYVKLAAGNGLSGPWHGIEACMNRASPSPPIGHAYRYQVGRSYRNPPSGSVAQETFPNAFDTRKLLYGLGASGWAAGWSKFSLLRKMLGTRRWSYYQNCNFYGCKRILTISKSRSACLSISSSPAGNWSLSNEKRLFTKESSRLLMYLLQRLRVHDHQRRSTSIFVLSANRGHYGQKTWTRI